MAVNFGVVVAGIAGLFILSKLGGARGTMADITATDAVAGFEFEEGFVGARVAADFFDGGLDFSAVDAFGEPPAGAMVASEFEFEEGFAGARAAADLERELAAEAARGRAAELAALPRIRQFYIDDLVNRLGVPLDFFGGSVPGATSDEVVLNYNSIYESYLQHLDIQSGQQNAVNELVALQAQLTQELNEAGVQGTPTGNTEAELRASAQALVDQFAAALIRQQRQATAAAAAEIEQRAQEQASAAEPTLAERRAASGIEFFGTFAFDPDDFSDPLIGAPAEDVQILPAPIVTLIDPVFEPTLAERREESGIEFFGTFAFDPDEF